MTMFRLAFVTGIIATAVCVYQHQRIVKSPSVKLGDEPDIGTTGSDVISIMEKNKDTPVGKGPTINKTLKNNHSCLAVELLTCDCSQVFANSSDLLVNCSNRNFVRVPENIPPNTVVLILSGNTIQNVSVGVFKNLTRLIELDLSGNEIHAFEDGIFHGLGSLECLYLNNNPFDLTPSSFGDDVFSPLTRLVELNIKSRNPDTEQKFNYPDKSLGKLKSLKMLIIDGLSNITFGTGFQNMASLATLDLSFSPLFSSIYENTFRCFQNISVKQLMLNKCSLTWIDPNALKYFPKIDTIDYSYNNKLEIEGVGKSFYGLQNTTIRKIIMQYVHSPAWFTSVSKKDIIYLINTKLEEIYMEHNSIVSFTNDALSFLPRSIKIASASWNIIQTTQQQILSFFRYRNLTQVIVSYQITYDQNYAGDYQKHTMAGDFPVTDKRLSENLMIPKIHDVSTGLNFMSFDLIKGTTVNFPPKLWNIQCSNTYKLKFVIPKMTLNIPSITHADFSYNLLNEWQGPVFGIETLLHLNLSGNDCDYVSPQFFGFLPNLQTLRIANNRLGPELLENIFDNLTSLRFLDMHKNLQEKTRPYLFSHLLALQELDMSSNYLTSWEADISGLFNLSRLNLKANKFNTLPPNLRENLDVLNQSRLVEVDISGNPFKCICETEDFVVWLTKTKVRVVNLTSTSCTLENGTTLSFTRANQILSYLQNHCRSYTILIVATSVCVGLSLIILICFIVHRNRWKLRYLLYVTLNRKERTGYQRLDSIAEESQYFFDAFVSYEDCSRDFIVNHIIPRLETDTGLKLCIDKRDFIPGLFVADNIMNAIRNSSKTVVVLTEEFLKSKWCMYELNMARMESLYNNRQTLIVVLLEDIPNKSLPREILDLFRRQTYIEMVEDPHGRELFWNRLICAIKMDE